MIVKRSDFSHVVNLLDCPGERGLDTETTGLKAYHQDCLFSLVIADEGKVFYFNFQEYEGLSDDWVLPRSFLPHFKPIFDNPNSIWYASNAKFDMAMLAREGLFIGGSVHCTEALGRVEKNDRLKYGLDALAKPLGLEKSDAVENWITENHAWEWEHIPGKEKRSKKKFFTRVPFPIIVPYGEQDGALVRRVGMYQSSTFRTIDQGVPEGHPKIGSVVENEKRFTKTCFKIEQTGILIDRDYCRRALESEEARLHDLKLEFETLTGLPFQDSRTVLEKAFRAAGESIRTTDKGNASFDDKALQSYTTPVAQVVRSYREGYKRANTYYRNFLYFSDSGGVLHPNLKQGGTGTGRVSCSEPNLLNLPDEESLEAEFKVRCAFIPRPGFFYFMPDYNQMEYRLMLDYAAEQDLIHQVNSGMDVHEATALMINNAFQLGISRGTAKTINFGLLYGMGKDALAAALGLPVDEAMKLKQAYFQALPFVQGFIRRVVRRAETVGYIFNWAGRRSYFDKKDFCYKAPNYLIQGGCGDVVKIAMNRIDDYLVGRKSRMLIQVYDEILFEIHESEASICHELMNIMETVYPQKYLQLTCSAEHSFKSWGDKVKGYAN